MQSRRWHRAKKRGRRPRSRVSSPERLPAAWPRARPGAARIGSSAACVSRDTARFTKRRSACTKSVSRFPESLRRQQKLEDVSNRQRDAPLAAFDDVPCGRTCQLAVDERPGDHFDAVL